MYRSFELLINKDIKVMLSDASRLSISMEGLSTMDEMRKQQLEVLQDAVPYSERVLAAIDEAVEQLQNGVNDAGFIKQVIEAINWILEVYNGTKSLVNQDGTAVDEEVAKNGVAALERAERFKDNIGKAEAIYNIGLFIKNFHDVASELIAN